MDEERRRQDEEQAVRDAAQQRLAEDRQHREKAEQAARKEWRGTGCPRCGSTAIQQRRETSSTGNSLLVAGIVLAVITCGLGIIICIIALCLREDRARCGTCGWTWRV